MTYVVSIDFRQYKVEVLASKCWHFSKQCPLTNFKSEMFCVKLMEITEWRLIWFLLNIMLTFIP